MSDFYPRADETPDLKETRIARVESETVSLAKIIFESRDQVNDRLADIEHAIAAQNKMLTAIMEGLQKPGSPMNNGLLEILARDKTRIRATEEAIAEITRVVCETH